MVAPTKFIEDRAGSKSKGWNKVKSSFRSGKLDRVANSPYGCPNDDIGTSHDILNTNSIVDSSMDETSSFEALEIANGRMNHPKHDPSIIEMSQEADSSQNKEVISSNRIEHLNKRNDFDKQNPINAKEESSDARFKCHMVQNSSNLKQAESVKEANVTPISDFIGHGNLDSKQNNKKRENIPEINSDTNTQNKHYQTKHGLNYKINTIFPIDPGLQESNEKDEDRTVFVSTRKRCIILPHDVLRTYWDIYVSFLLLYVGAFVPYRISFLGELKGFLKYCEIFVDTSFGIDIALNFFTAYETKNGILECRHWKIAKRYLKGFFLLDVIATFPMDVVLKNFFGSEISGVNQASKLTKLPKLIKILKITRLLKLLRFYRLQLMLRQIQLNHNVHQGVSRLGYIVMVILFATHFVGCFWHGIGVDLDIPRAASECHYASEKILGDIEYIEQGWVCREGMTNHALYHKYIASIYWAFSTLTTVGYGDIFARTVSEQAFSMLMMLLGVSWYAYVVGSISTVLASFDRQNKIMREKLLQVNNFIRETKLPYELGQRIRKYYEYSLSKKKNGLSTFDADEILQELSASLMTDVITHVEADLISKIPFFKGKSGLFVANTVQALRPIVVQEGDFIIKEGSAADEMFFLVKGTASVFYGEVKVNTLTEGSYFGEIGCILGGIRRAGIIAQTTCELQCLSKRSLNILLGQHPEVGEDLKAVARARMSKVRKTNSLNGSSDIIKRSPKRTSKYQSQHVGDKVCSKETKKDTVHLENNLRKLEKLDFKTIEETSDAFAELRSDVEGMARRLSLTSGVLASGSHIKADKEIIDMLNDDGADSVSSSNEERVKSEQSDCELNSIHYVENESDKINQNQNRESEVDRVISSLNETDQAIIFDFMIYKIQHEVGDRLLRLSNRIRKYNLEMLKKVFNEEDEH